MPDIFSIIKLTHPNKGDIKPPDIMAEVIYGNIDYLTACQKMNELVQEIMRKNIVRIVHDRFLYETDELFICYQIMNVPVFSVVPRNVR